MKLQNDPATEVFINDNGLVAISQPDEQCPCCGNTETIYVVFTSKRAKLIAKELYRLAREIDSHSKQ